MKKFVVFLMALMCMTVAQAQVKGNMAAGVNLDMGFGYDGDYDNMGIGVKFQYSVTDQIRVEPTFVHYFEKNYLTMNEFMVNAHYLFPMMEGKLNVYPLAGLGLVTTKVEVSFLGITESAKESDFGLDLGGGAEYKLTDNISLGAELKYYLVGDWNHLGLQIGATYAF